MQDDVSPVVGIEGWPATGVLEVGRRLEIEVELVARAGCCRWCGRASVSVKDRAVVCVRDLPVAGRVTVARAMAAGATRAAASARGRCRRPSTPAQQAPSPPGPSRSGSR